jgi:transposase
MLTTEQRALIISQLRAGRRVPEITPFFSKICSKATLYRVAKEFSAGVEEKQKKKQKRPWRKIEPKMAATIIRRLTINKAQHSIRSVTRDFMIDPKSIRNLLQKKGINCYKKKKRNLIPRTEETKRRFCCMRFRKAFRRSDLSDLLFVDECYFTVQKSFNHQNERCFGKNFQAIPDGKKFKQLPKTPLSAMVFAGVSREGRTPLVVFKSGFDSINTPTRKSALILSRKTCPSN